MTALPEHVAVLECGGLHERDDDGGQAVADGDQHPVRHGAAVVRVPDTLVRAEEASHVGFT